MFYVTKCFYVIFFCVVLAFRSYNEIAELINLQKEKGYFGSPFWTSQSIIDTLCTGPVSEAAENGKSLWKETCLGQAFGVENLKRRRPKQRLKLCFWCPNDLLSTSPTS